MSCALPSTSFFTLLPDEEEEGDEDDEEDEDDEDDEEDDHDERWLITEYVLRLAARAFSGG